MLLQTHWLDYNRNIAPIAIQKQSKPYVLVKAMCSQDSPHCWREKKTKADVLQMKLTAATQTQNSQRKRQTRWSGSMIAQKLSRSSLPLISEWSDSPESSWSGKWRNENERPDRELKWAPSPCTRQVLYWHRMTPAQENIVSQNNPIISFWQVYKIPSEQADDRVCNNTLPII